MLSSSCCYRKVDEKTEDQRFQMVGLLCLEQEGGRRCKAKRGEVVALGCSEQ